MSGNNRKTEASVTTVAQSIRKAEWISLPKQVLWRSPFDVGWKSITASRFVDVKEHIGGNLPRCVCNTGRFCDQVVERIAGM